MKRKTFRLRTKPAFGGSDGKANDRMKKRTEKLDKELEGYWIKNNDKDNGKTV